MIRTFYKGLEDIDARVYELDAYYDSRKSFYSKAKIIETFIEGRSIIKELQSYDTIVARIETSIDTGTTTVIIDDTYSATTSRHIKEFLRQEIGYIGTKRDLERDFIIECSN